MTYQEKENLLNIFSALLINIVYVLAIYRRHMDGQIDLTNDYVKWGVIFFIYVGISIVARIIIYIIFHIINSIATRNDKIPVEDERAKLIKLKASRASHIGCSVGLLVGMLFLALGHPPYVLIMSFVGFCMLGDIAENLVQLRFHRRGF